MRFKNVRYVKAKVSDVLHVLCLNVLIKISHYIIIHLSCIKKTSVASRGPFPKLVISINRIKGDYFACLSFNVATLVLAIVHGNKHGHVSSGPLVDHQMIHPLHRVPSGTLNMIRLAGECCAHDSPYCYVPTQKGSSMNAQHNPECTVYKKAVETTTLSTFQAKVAAWQASKSIFSTQT